MKKSWLNMESSNMNADGLWEKDEIVMRRPSSASNNKRSKLSAATATTLDHNNELFPELYHHHHHHHHQYVISGRSEKSGKEMTRPLAADSHLVPDKDDEAPEFMGNYLMISSSGSDHHEIPPATTKLVDDDHGQIDEYYCKSKNMKKGNSSNRAAGLLHFVTHFSRAHDDGRPAVVATSSAFNSTPKTTCTTTALLVPTNHHHSWPNSKPKRKLVETNCCCNEALVPSFSVCSNDVPSVSLVRTTPHHSPCPSNSIEAEDEPPRPNYKAPPRAAQRKRRTTAVHNLSERRRRDKINKKMRALQALIPNCNKVNKASILDEAIEYMKTLQLQLQMMSMGTGVMPPNPMLLGSGAPPHLRTTFALPPPTFQMLGFPPPLPPAPFLPSNIAPSLPLVSPSISLSLSSSNNSKPTHLKHHHRTQS